MSRPNPVQVYSARGCNAAGHFGRRHDVDRRRLRQSVPPPSAATMRVVIPWPGSTTTTSRSTPHRTRLDLRRARSNAGAPPARSCITARSIPISWAPSRCSNQALAGAVSRWPIDVSRTGLAGVRPIAAVCQQQRGCGLLYRRGSVERGIVVTRRGELPAPLGGGGKGFGVTDEQIGLDRTPVPHEAELIPRSLVRNQETLDTVTRFPQQSACRGADHDRTTRTPGISSITDWFASEPRHLPARPSCGRARYHRIPSTRSRTRPRQVRRT